MPADTIQYKTFVYGLNFVMETIHKPTETLAKHSARLQPSINLHAPALCSAPNVLPRRDEGSGKPCAVTEAL